MVCGNHMVRHMCFNTNISVYQPQARRNIRILEPNRQPSSAQLPVAGHAPKSPKIAGNQWILKADDSKNQQQQ